MDFLILKPSSLGDVIHAFPAVSALVRAYPGANIDWLIHPAFAELTAYLPAVRRNIFFERKKLGKISSFFPAFSQLRSEIRKKPYDAVIDLQGLTRSAAIGRMARSKVFAGSDSPREFPAAVFYNRKLHAPTGIHAVERNNAMIADFLQRDDLDFPFQMEPVSRFVGQADEILRQTGVDGKPYAVIAPGARWKTKQWPTSFFADVMNRIGEKHPDLCFLIAGSGSDSVMAAEILQLAKVPCYDLCGKTSLGELVEVTRKAKLFFCNDSGPMHIAAALNIPVLTMFGPTSPVLTGPYSKKNCILQPTLPCISCMMRYCSTCECHNAVNPEVAAESAESLLATGVVP